MENSEWAVTGPLTIVPPAPLVYSPTHPVQGEHYPDNDVEFGWIQPYENMGIAGYSWDFDNDSSTIPDGVVDTVDNFVIIENVPDGLWHFHVRAVSTTGIAGKTAHFSVWIKRQPEAELPAITVAEGQQKQPAVAYGNNRFLVVWNDWDTLIRGKIYDIDRNVVKIELRGMFEGV